MEQSNKHYEADNIQVLEGLEAVKKRPGMYIGTTGPRGLHHLVWEIVDNSVDEALAGFCDTISVSLLPGEIVEVEDNGRGIPVGIHEKTKIPAVQTIFTVLHAGGKFDHNSYKVSGGLHGVGASVVNALSEWLEVVIHKDGKIYKQKFNHGFIDGNLEELGSTDKSGTKVKFKADPEIFKETTIYDFETLRVRIQQLAFLNKGIRFEIQDLRKEEPKKFSYMYEGGVREYVHFLNEGNDFLNPNVMYFEGIQEGISVEIGMQYNSTYGSSLYSFTNNIHNPEGGTHEEGFKLTLTRIINNYAKNNNFIKKEEAFSGEDVREGLIAIVSIKHPDPQFEGQTKSKLGSTDARRVVANIMSEGLERFLLEHPQDAKNILDKAVLAYHARIAAKKAREATRRKSPLDSLGLASKLSDCHCKEPSKSEIYLVEGDSAGGSAKQGRDAEFQAILPLRGKVLNVEKVKLDRALENKEILSMIQAFGTGFGDDFNEENIRYHKIVIMTDADVDGAHIRILLLTFFYRFMPKLIEHGFVYVAQPPLYKVQAGKTVAYAYSDEELQEELAKLNVKPSIQRYKGLGEMDPEQLWETTMDPAQRTLLKVTSEDAIEADRTFTMLMGEDVEPRREFIQDNALYVKNLDF